MIAEAHKAHQCKWLGEGGNGDVEAKGDTKPSDLGRGEWQSAPPTDHSDRVCEDIMLCNATAEWVSTPHTRFSDRACTPLTIPLADEYISLNKTLRSDRVCTKATVCKEGEEYQTQAFSRFVNRMCKPLRKCRYTNNAPYGTLLSQGRPTAMSSQYSNWNSNRCVDGSTNTHGPSGSVCGTNRQNEPWFRVDLQRRMNVGVVRVWNRYDAEYVKEKRRRAEGERNLHVCCERDRVCVLCMRVEYCVRCAMRGVPHMQMLIRPNNDITLLLPPLLPPGTITSTSGRCV